MSMWTRVPFTGVAILFLAMITCIAASAQNRINDRFAVVNGVRLHYPAAGKGDLVAFINKSR